MQLYYSPPSPFVRKVMVLLHETGQLDAVTIVPVEAAPSKTEASPAPGNPLGKIPTPVWPFYRPITISVIPTPSWPISTPRSRRVETTSS
ncbi:MAG: glutathione S-transferase N-terminal domain-containing protein, partial [Pseudomonadota bacterium]